MSAPRRKHTDRSESAEEVEVHVGQVVPHGFVRPSSVPLGDGVDDLGVLVAVAAVSLRGETPLFESAP